jgi:hypothetical protein
VHVKLQWQDAVYALFQGHWFTLCTPCHITEADRNGRLT